MNWLSFIARPEYWSILKSSVGKQADLVSTLMLRPTRYRYVSDTVDTISLKYPVGYTPIGGNRFANITERVELGIPCGMEPPGSKSYDKEETVKMLRNKIENTINLKIRGNKGYVRVGSLFMTAPNNDFHYPVNILLKGARFRYKPRWTTVDIDSVLLRWEEDRPISFPKVMLIEEMTAVINNDGQIIWSNLENTKGRIVLSYALDASWNSGYDVMTQYGFNLYLHQVKKDTLAIPPEYFLENFNPFDFSFLDQKKYSQELYLNNEAYDGKI